MSDREDAIKGLRALADFLEAHPDLPPPWDVSAVASAGEGTHDEKRARVDRIAVILGEDPQWSGESRSHYGVERHFGGVVTYRITAITEAHMETWREHMSKFEG